MWVSDTPYWQAHICQVWDHFRQGFFGIPPIEPLNSELQPWAELYDLWNDCGVLVSDLGLLGGLDGAVDGILR